MSERVLSMYLAGAIRDDKTEDIDWREKVIDGLKSLPVRILNPLAGKQYEGGQWTVSGVPSSAKFITKHDKFMVRDSDMVLFNFRALSQGYPNIGTLVEFGMAVAYDKLIYVIIDPDYIGHGNQRMYKLHPFIAEFAAVEFNNTEEAITFLNRHIKAISGRAPSFPPYRIEQSVRATQDAANAAGNGR